MGKSIVIFATMFFFGCSMNDGDDIDRLFAGYRPDGTPGASIMIIRDGQVLDVRNYGVADMESGSLVTPATNFRLASVTKQFTATAILILVEQGLLQLDDAVRKFFPKFPDFMDQITIRHLLQHTSGIEDYEPLYGDRFPEQILDRGVVDIIATTSGTYFSPGTEYRYSNSAYAILAVLVENLSGETFPQFLDRNIFSPLGMNETVAYRRGTNEVTNRAFGYQVDRNTIEPADQSAWSAVLGDGGVYSSVMDLYKWDQALYDNDLLSADMWRQAWTPGLENYGFGWRIDDYNGNRRLHHSGSTSGFRNFMQRFPDEQLTIIVLTNRAEPDVKPLAEKIADLHLN